MNMPNVLSGSENDRIFAMGVNMIFFFGVVLSIFAPNSYIILIPLYLVPLVASFIGASGSLLRQHAVRVLCFSVLFTVVYPLLALMGQVFVMANWGGHPEISERLLDAMIHQEEYGLVRLVLAAAVTFDETRRELLAIDLLVYVLAFCQLALLLQSLMWSTINVDRAHQEKSPNYPWIIK
jgi:hypothetical protein